MKKLSGIAVSSGIVFGKAIVKQKKKLKIDREFISSADKKEEIEKFNSALELELQELDRFIENYSTTKEDKALLDTYKAILRDPLLSERILALIEQDNFTVENALYKFYNELIGIFGKMTSIYHSERISDYEDVIFKLINRLTGQKDTLIDQEALEGEEDLILVIDKINPSDVTKSYHSNIKGICLEKGSKTSHSAIIARALGLPVVIGIDDLFSHISNNDNLIVDGEKGQVIVNPTKKEFQEYENLSEKLKRSKRELEELINLPSETKDGKKISLMSNIELEHELDFVLKINSDGIGLFRTEFLFVNKETQPSEEEQFQLYKRLAEKLAGKQLVIRTYDLGGDKIANLVTAPQEMNPYLGCRGIRLSLKYPAIFKKQIKAILRAGCYGNIAMMFPMITNVEDMRDALEIVSECKKELKENKIPFDPEVKTGVMIEVPAAVLSAAELAKISDFFSIGTNDLVQYTLAADRNSDTVSKYYDPYHPAVFKLLAMTISAAHRFERPVSVCGEIASEPDFICLLIALGVDALSVNPGSQLIVKKSIMQCNYAEKRKMIKKIFQLSSSQEVRDIMRKFNR